jgi:hypothetical protein
LWHAAGAALFVWFIWLVRGGLASWFSGDDLMNLHYYWERPWAALLKANLMFWSSYYRPAGGLFYRSIYTIWGLNPLPFHMVALAWLSLDFALLAVVVWQLTRSRWSVLLALLLVGINPSFAQAYFDTGTIYDVLAYAFYWGAFALYVHFRRVDRVPGWGRLALVLGLFVAALDAKEIAVSLPVAVALYELVWHRPASWKLAEWWRWLRHEGRFAVLGGCTDIAYILGKKYGPGSLWEAELYRPRLSVSAYFQSLSHYLSQLIYQPVIISSWQVAGLLAVMLALAVITRRRCLLWGVGFIAAGVLPIAFIAPRGGFAYLVPSVGWAVYAGGMLDWLLESLAGGRLRLRSVVHAVLLAALAVVVAPWQRTSLDTYAKATHDEQARYRRYIEQVHALIPAPRKGAMILLLSDADQRDNWNVYFVIRLHYGDPKLGIYRMTVWKQYRAQVDPSSYDYILDYVNNRFVLVSAASVAQTYRPAPAVQDPPAVGPGLYDDADPAIVYEGPWAHDKGWAHAHLTTIAFSNSPGSKVTLAFQGSSLAYIYTKAANRGRADIAIDGAGKAVLDLYSPKPEWQSRTLFKLDAGRHLATITLLPDNNPKSADRFIDVDAFEVR